MIEYKSKLIYYSREGATKLTPQATENDHYWRTDLLEVSSSDKEFSVAYLQNKGPVGGFRTTLALVDDSKSDPFDKLLLMADEIYLPTQDIVYAVTQSNNVRYIEKYLVTKDGLSRQGQPIYYIGLETKTADTVSVFSSPDHSKLIATIAKGTRIVLVGVTSRQGDPNIVALARTGIGLTGYVFPRQLNKTEISGEMTHYDISFFDHKYVFHP